MTVTPFAPEHVALADVVSRVVADLAGDAEQAEQQGQPPAAALSKLRAVDAFELGDVLAEVAVAQALGRLRSLGLVLVALDQMAAADAGVDVTDVVAVARRAERGALAPLATAASLAQHCVLLDDATLVGVGAVEPVETAALRGAGWGEVYVDVEHARTLDVSDGVIGRTAVREAAAVVAAGWQAFDDACVYAAQRTAFGRPISRFQVNRHSLATVATHLQAAEALVHDAAWRLSNNDMTDAGGAWRYAAAANVEATDVALQLHGGYGYTTDFDIERAWRDARAFAARGAPA